MTQALLITLREGLEISLLVVIVLAYLKRTGRGYLFLRVWQGVALATAASLVAGALLFGLGTGLEGKAEAVFEGSAIFLAVIVLSWMIMWMKRQARHIRGELEDQGGASGGTWICLRRGFAGLPCRGKRGTGDGPLVVRRVQGGNSCRDCHRWHPGAGDSYCAGAACSIRVATGSTFGSSSTLRECF